MKKLEKFWGGTTLSFQNQKEEEAFRARLLENSSPVKGRFGDASWSAFEETTGGSWSEEDRETAGFCGGGFYSLPTIEAMEGGIVCFLTAEQKTVLSTNPWIAEWDFGPAKRKPLQGHFAAADDIDLYVVVDIEK